MQSHATPRPGMQHCDVCLILMAYRWDKCDLAVQTADALQKHWIHARLKTTYEIGLGWIVLFILSLTDWIQVAQGKKKMNLRLQSKRSHRHKFTV